MAYASACDARSGRHPAPRIFGPVLTIQHFADDEEGIRWANDVPIGLASPVWTKDIKRGLNAARRLRFGTVWINDHLTIASEMPHGGFKQSGHGKDMSSYSIEGYTVIKHVMAKIADERPMELMGRTTTAWAGWRNSLRRRRPPLHFSTLARNQDRSASCRSVTRVRQWGWATR